MAERGSVLSLGSSSLGDTGCIFGNVGYAVITMDALNYFFPPYFAGGNTIYAIIGGSILIWLFNFVVLRGTQQAAVINTIGTIGKLIPLFVFIIIMIFVFISISSISTSSASWRWTMDI